jgi:ABC-2 type transport system permease protein
MRTVDIFLFEFKHFSRNKFKVLAFILFLLAGIYAIYNGISLQQKQQLEIKNIEQQALKDKQKVIAWFDEGKKGPEDRPWIDINEPYWALGNTPVFVFKKPSPLLPLSIGQTEQYGYYKSITIRSSAYDQDMVEEIANPERLINGNIDFLFVLIFLMPLLLIILVYNLNGLEKDLSFDKLVSVQTGNKLKWLFIRLSFYILTTFLSMAIFIMLLAVNREAFSTHSTELSSFLKVTVLYFIFWTFILYIIISNSNGSSSQAFRMISIWLILCVLIPGAIHQYASMKYPANYMTNYLDASRKEANEIYELSPDTLAKELLILYPELKNTKYGKDTIIDESIVGNSISALLNSMNKKAITNIEDQNEQKNKLIEFSYWFNPVSLFQNQLNRITSTDYYAYHAYRKKVQMAIDKKIRLLVFETWDKKNVDKARYGSYSILLE